MKISKIRIEIFRSIRSSEFALDDFNIIVGQNNCGKTNFFEAVEFFFIGKGVDVNDLKFNKEANNEIEIEIEFTGAQAGLEQMKNPANKTKIANALDGSM